MLKEALMESFDPFTNEEIKNILETDRKMDLSNKDVLNDYYKEPVKCMLRIKDSVEVWLKRNGCNGYFVFLENWMGQEIPKDDKMNYSIYI